MQLTFDLCHLKDVSVGEIEEWNKMSNDEQEFIACHIFYTLYYINYYATIMGVWYIVHMFQIQDSAWWTLVLTNGTSSLLKKKFESVKNPDWSTTLEGRPIVAHNL